MTNNRTTHRPIGQPATYPQRPREILEIEIDGQLWTVDTIEVTRWRHLAGHEVTRLAGTNPQPTLHL